MSFPLVGSPQATRPHSGGLAEESRGENLSEEPEGLSASADPLRLGGQAAMTESDNDVALLMNSLVTNFQMHPLYESQTTFRL